MLTAQWAMAYMEQCYGYPDVMYGYYLSDESAFANRNVSEKWPQGYRYQASKQVYSKRCYGTIKIPVSLECCAYSIDPVQNRGWEATSTILAEKSSFLDAAPTMANGGTYCAIKANVNNNRTLFGMDQAYYLNSGKCVTPDSVACFPNGTFAVYPTSNCGGNPSIFDLNTAKAFSTTQTLGVSGSIVTVREGQSEFSWTIILEVSRYFPTFKYFSDYMMVIIMGSAALACVLSAAYFIRQAIRNRQFYSLVMAFCQVCWAIFVATRIFNQFGFYNNMSNGTLFLFEMIGSLLSVELNLWFFLTMLNASRLTSFLSLGFVFILHCGLNWNNYIRYDSLGIPFGSLIFMFWFDCIPPLYCIYLLFRDRGPFTWPLIKAIVKRIEVSFLVSLFLQILVSLAFILQDRIRNYTEILGHDRVWLSFIAIDTACLAYHSLLNVILILSMKKTVVTNSETQSFSLDVVGKENKSKGAQTQIQGSSLDL
ncbi:hypothetical protein EDD86DRAFT_245273 [Gorgonomyces haynaldii]|nr:hypothetical protein EDD86DRAFT_245273 [Gorgonomyces haynaldii]